MPLSFVEGRFSLMRSACVSGHACLGFAAKRSHDTDAPLVSATAQLKWAHDHPDWAGKVNLSSASLKRVGPDLDVDSCALRSSLSH